MGKKKARGLGVFAADTHLGGPAWVNRPEIEGDDEVAFEQMVDYACKHRMEWMMVAGDILDKKRNVAAPLSFFRRQMDQLEGFKVAFGFIQGQHEEQDWPWPKAIHNWPIWLDVGRQFTAAASNPGYFLGKHRIWGIDWTHRSQLEDRLKQVPKGTDVLLMHQVCQQWMGGITNPEMALEQVPCARLLLIGDYHKHCKVKTRGREGQELLAISPGSSHMREISEEPVKKFYVVREDLTVRSVTLPGRPFIQAEPILMEVDLERFVETVTADIETAANTATGAGTPKRILKPLLRVEYRVDIPDVYSRIVTAVRDQAHLFGKELIPEEDEEAEELRRQSEEVLESGLVGALPLVVEDTDSELYQATEQMLSTVDILAAISRLRSEHISEKATENEEDDEEGA